MNKAFFLVFSVVILTIFFASKKKETAPTLTPRPEPEMEPVAKPTTGTQGPAGQAGPAGPAGPAGTNGAKLLNGNGEPSNDLSGTTIIGDYYLDSNNGNLWQRQAYTGSAGPTTLINPGNVQWERVANLKGPAGLSRLDENTIIELNQDIKSETDNVPRFKFLSDRMKVFKRLSIQELVDNFSEFVMSAFDGVGEKQLFRLKARNDDGDSIIEFYGNNMSTEHKFAQYDGVGKLFSIFGSGLRVPNQTSTEIAANSQAQVNAGALVRDSTTGVLRVSTGAGWVDVLVNGARVVLGGTDNLTDKLQVTGTIKATGRITSQGASLANGNLNNHCWFTDLANGNIYQGTGWYRGGGGIHTERFRFWSSEGWDFVKDYNNDYNVPALFTIRENGQIGAGTSSPNISAQVEFSSTNKGFLMQRMTQAEADAIPSKANWLQVIVTDGANPGPRIWDGSAWRRLSLI
jgi:hypothetical protein